MITIDDITSEQARALVHAEADRDNRVFDDAKIERARQLAKWGPQDHEMGTWIAILGEEFGEVCKDSLEGQAAADRDDDELADWYAGKARNELIQVAAVALAAAANIDLYLTPPPAPTDAEIVEILSAIEPNYGQDISSRLEALTPEDAGPVDENGHPYYDGSTVDVEFSRDGIELEHVEFCVSYPNCPCGIEDASTLDQARERVVVATLGLTEWLKENPTNAEEFSAQYVDLVNATYLWTKGYGMDEAALKIFLTSVGDELTRRTGVDMPKEFTSKTIETSQGTKSVGFSSETI